ncbi:MAG: hypothetical protein IJR66_04350 [Clostridia bacterium]|nr:hypothetical protein [Clostridia bacterium]
MNPWIIAAIVVAVLINVCLCILETKKNGKKQSESERAVSVAEETDIKAEESAPDLKQTETENERVLNGEGETETADEDKTESQDKIIVIPRVSKRPFFLYGFNNGGENGLTVGGLEDVAVKRKTIKKVPFYKNLLKAEKAVKLSYDEIYNKFLEYKKLHARVSSKCTSFRFGRELVAKLTYHGRTMKLHLALDVDKYNVNKYHQKDLKNKKSYEEVPFTVKVKSERARKNAIELITLLAEEKQFSVKKNIEKFDSIKELKNMKK